MVTHLRRLDCLDSQRVGIPRDHHFDLLQRLARSYATRSACSGSGCVPAAEWTSIALPRNECLRNMIDASPVAICCMPSAMGRTPSHRTGSGPRLGLPPPQAWWRDGRLRDWRRNAVPIIRSDQFEVETGVASRNVDIPFFVEQDLNPALCRGCAPIVCGDWTYFCSRWTPEVARIRTRILRV